MILLFVLVLRFTVVRDKLAESASSFLSRKVGAPVSVMGFDIGLLHLVNLHEVYAQDLKGDTLLYAEKISADLDLGALLKNRIQLERIVVKRLAAKVYRQFPDTNFNYSFIVTAFSGSSPEEVEAQPDTSAAGWVFGIGNVQLEQLNVTYVDDFAGVDLSASIGFFSCSFRKFDLDNNTIIVNSLVLKDNITRYAQHEPKDTVKTINEPSAPWIFGAEKMRIGNTSVVFTDTDSSQYSAQVGGLLLTDGGIDLGSSEIDAKKIELGNSVVQVIMMPAKNSDVEAGNQDTADVSQGWKINVKQILLSDNKVHFQVKGEPDVVGFNPSLLRLTGLSLQASEFLMNDDDISVAVGSLALQEKKGFSVSRLSGKFHYNDKGASVNDLQLITPYSAINRDLSVSYNSLEELTASPEKAEFDVQTKNTIIGLHDLYYFVPALSHSLVLLPHEKIYLDAEISGSLAHLKNSIDVRWRTSSVKIKGELRDVMKPESFFADLSLIAVRSGKSDIAALLPAGTLPAGFSLPDSLSLDADFLGYTKNYNSNIELRSNLGQMRAEVNMDPAKGNTMVPYAGTVITEGLALDRILSRSELGKLTFSIALKGTGMDTSNFNSDLSLNVISFEYNKYQYKDLAMQGHLLKSAFEGTATMRDDNIAFDFDGLVNIDPTAPRFRYSLDLKGVDFKKLNLSDEDFRLSLTMQADIVLPVHENPLGKAGIYNLVVKRGEKKHYVDSLVLEASTSEGVTTLALRGDKLNGKAKGTFKVTEIAPAVVSYINSHFDLDPGHGDSIVSNQQVDFQLTLTDPTFLTTGLIPGLERLTPTEFKGSFNSKEKLLTASMDLPEMIYNGIRVDSLKFDVKGDERGVNYNVSLAQVSDTINFRFENMSLQGEAANDTVDFAFATAKDDSVKVLALSGNLASVDSLLVLHLDKEATLNAGQWTIDSTNQLTFGAVSTRISNLVAGNGTQMISVNHEGPDNALTTKFRDFELGTISNMMSHRIPLAGGTLNGDFIIEKQNGRAAFRSDLDITALSYKANPIGNVKLKADNFSDPSVYEINLGISGGDNDVRLAGAFRTKSKNSLDFEVNVGKLNLAALEAFTGGEVTRLGGWISGNLKMGGNPEAPKIDGGIQIHDFMFRPRMLDATYRIPEGELLLASEKIRFNSLTLLDSLGNKATVTGYVDVSTLSDPSFDLKLNTKDFIAMNTDKYDNSLYFGKIFLDSDVRLTGSVSKPDVDVKANLGKKSTLTYIKPADQIMKNETDGIVEFSDSLEKYTKIISREDSAKIKGVIGLSLNADITVNEEVELKVIVDPMAGDSLYLQGGGRLNYSMDRSGNTSLSGKYKITKGGYFLTISDFVKRDFKIEPGSTVSWSGDPLDPYADLKAVYRLKASPVDLMQDQVSGLTETDANKYRNLLNFDVYLIMSGFISSPQISFDIQLAPQDRGAVGGEVNNRLAQLRTDESQLNKQVFALLTLRRFVSENPLESGGGGDFASAGRSSASKILTQQLNTLSDRYVNFVDLDVGVNSYEDYSSGTQQGRTQVQVGVSKQFFNDRVGVRVGGSVDVEGEEASKNKASDLAGNISVDYSLTEDKRYRVRGFRETQYENPLDGEVTKTGIGFVFTRDFNRFKNMFRKPRSQANAEKKTK